MSTRLLRRWLPGTALVSVALLLALLPLPGRAASFTVTRFDDPPPGACAPGDCSLREALIAANAAPGADTITLPAGVYQLAIAGGAEQDGATGDLDINQNTGIAGPGAAIAVIDGGDLDRVFDVEEGVTATISGVTIRDGDSGSEDGGGVRNYGTLTFTGVVATSNEADDAGAINNFGSLTLTRSTVSNNSAGDVAGGIFNAPGATLTLTGSTISGNTSSSVGGGINNFSTVTVEGSTISGNTSNGFGGGIMNFSQATISDSTISGNTSPGLDGGGIYNDAAGTLTLTNATIAGNTAGRDGGGIYNNGGTVTVTRSAIANSTGGGDCAGSAPTSSGHNIDSDNTCGLTGTGDQPGVDPLLGPLADNGGPTKTHTLLSGSPAIDGGSTCTGVDQRGVFRPLDGDGNTTFDCDIGAVEVGPFDTDGDGCIDEREAGPDAPVGGLRSPKNFWDFFDVPAGGALTRDGDVTGFDIFAVLARFNATDTGPGAFNRNSDPLSTPNPSVPGAFRANYHPAYDRGALLGSEPWDRGPPDGSITGSEIFVVIAQFGHSCE